MFAHHWKCYSLILGCVPFLSRKEECWNMILQEPRRKELRRISWVVFFASELSRSDSRGLRLHANSYFKGDFVGEEIKIVKRIKRNSDQEQEVGYLSLTLSVWPHHGTNDSYAVLEGEIVLWAGVRPVDWHMILSYSFLYQPNLSWNLFIVLSCRSRERRVHENCPVTSMNFQEMAVNLRKIQIMSGS